MLHTIEAVIDEHGAIRLSEPIRLPTPHRALVTILNDPLPSETALLSEAALEAEIERNLALVLDPHHPIAQSNAEVVRYWQENGLIGSVPRKPGELDSPELVRQWREATR